MSVDNEIKDQKEAIFENIEKQDLENNQNINTISDNTVDDLSEEVNDNFEKDDELKVEEN